MEAFGVDEVGAFRFLEFDAGSEVAVEVVEASGREGVADKEMFLLIRVGVDITLFFLLFLAFEG